MSAQPSHGRRGESVAIICAVVVVLAAIVYASLAPSPTSEQEQLREVTTTIRCPVCIGESIADSTAPISLAMRDEAQAQLEEGATPHEVREFFANAYGPDVLLMPELRGSGGLVWAVPVGIAGVLLVLLAGAVTLWLRQGGQVRWSRTPVMVTTSAVVLLLAAVAAVTLNAPVLAEGGGAHETSGAVEALAQAVENQPADVDVRLAYGTALKTTGQDGLAHEQFAAAYRLAPLDPDVAYLHASALLATGEVEEAGLTLDGLLEHSPEHGAALLMRGVMLWQSGDERATQLLTQFLETSPDDPAADAVRDMVEST